MDFFGVFILSTGLCDIRSVSAALCHPFFNFDLNFRFCGAFLSYMCPSVKYTKQKAAATSLTIVCTSSSFICANYLKLAFSHGVCLSERENGFDCSVFSPPLGRLEREIPVSCHKSTWNTSCILQSHHGFVYYGKLLSNG